jgi:predicted dehydrogenase
MGEGTMKSTSRREFLKVGTAVAGAVWVAPRFAIARTRQANEKLNIAIIGAGGQGAGNLRNVASENIVALCDVDEQRAGESFSAYPQAKRYKDFRKMLDEMHHQIDAVVVSTPDHTHAVASVAAMKLGKHVYCEKPLTHNIHEARVMREVAARQRVVTQMGNQGHSNTAARQAMEIIRRGVIGPVREVHAWTDRPIWPQGTDRPKEAEPVPRSLDWDLWLGPAPYRPYHSAYVPFKWRGWWDFGTGALGDMACHVLDVAFWALELVDPVTVEAEVSDRNKETYPKWSIIRYEFPARGSLPPCKLVWYDGGKKPPQELAPGVELPSNGTILVGEKGTLVTLDAYGGTYKLLPEKEFEGFKPPELTMPVSPGHHKEWILACKGEGKAMSNFDYAARLTETVLLGNVAIYAGQKIEWDAQNMRVKNVPEANAVLKREYRKGWVL